MIMFKKFTICLIIAAVLAMGMAGCKSSNTSQVALQPAIASEGDVGGYHYSIQEQAGYWQQSQTAGYYMDTLDEPNAPYFVFITSGEKKTTGYGVEVTGIDVDSNNFMTITVQFTDPDSKASVKKEKSYPTTCVTLDKMPDDITVELTDGSTLKWLR